MVERGSHIVLDGKADIRLRVHTPLEEFVECAHVVITSMPARTTTTTTGTTATTTTTTTATATTTTTTTATTTTTTTIVTATWLLTK